jgi:hypothetical protein
MGERRTGSESGSAGRADSASRATHSNVSAHISGSLPHEVEHEFNFSRQLRDLNFYLVFRDDNSNSNENDSQSKQMIELLWHILYKCLQPEPKVMSLFLLLVLL